MYELLSKLAAVPILPAANPTLPEYCVPATPEPYEVANEFSKR